MNRRRLLGILMMTQLGGAAPAALGAVVLAGNYTWFDEHPNARPVSGPSPLLRTNATSLHFDIPLQSLAPAEDDARPPTGDPTWGTLRLYRIQGEALSADNDPRRTTAMGVVWQHRLFPKDRLSLSAEMGENLRFNSLAQDTVESRAAVSWTHEWNVRWRPSLTGSMFFGDESARTDAYRQQLGRRFVGMSFGGQVTVGRDHTPYVSYQLRRSYYGHETGGDELLPPPRIDDRSLLAAGWRWQATRSLSLKAEASFGLNADGVDLYNQERKRVFFGTRFDFR